MVSKQIEIVVKNDIIKEIDKVIDRYIKDGLTLNQLKKYFNSKSKLSNIIKDINEIGMRHFDTVEEYKVYILKSVKEVIDDKISEEETNKLQENMKQIKKFSEFEYQKESVEYKDITPEYLFNNIEAEDNAEDINILSTYFKTNKDYIEVLDTNYCVYAITDFKADILKNNRVKLNVLFLSIPQVDKMRENIVNKILSGIYEQIPQKIEYMGILVNPYTVLDKVKIKEAIDEIVKKNIIDIISNVTKYSYIEKYDDRYHIWKKIK